MLIASSAFSWKWYDFPTWKWHHYLELVAPLSYVFLLTYTYVTGEALYGHTFKIWRNHFIRSFSAAVIMYVVLRQRLGKNDYYVNFIAHIANSIIFAMTYGLQCQQLE